MGWGVEPGHVELGGTATDRQVFVVCAAGAAELLVVALITKASGGGEKIRVSREAKVRG